MKCFKIFFKHTWQPQQMDITRNSNRSKQELDIKNITELGEVKILRENPSTSSFTDTDSAMISCKNGGCNKLLNRQGSKTENPWHYSKTVSLTAIIILLFIWIIIYAILSHYEVV